MEWNGCFRDWTGCFRIRLDALGIGLDALWNGLDALGIGLDASGKRRITCHCRKSNSDLSVVQPVTYSQYRFSYTGSFMNRNRTVS
jgi:hypothetical protein